MYHCLFFSLLYTPQWLKRFCLATISLFTSSLMTKKKRTATQFFNDVKLNDLKSLNKVNINNNTVFKHLKFSTEINYN